MKVPLRRRNAANSVVGIMMAGEFGKLGRCCGGGGVLVAIVDGGTDETFRGAV